jgi:hypothetical protein
MQTLNDASVQLFRRGPDECVESLQALWDRCYADKEAAEDHWLDPGRVLPSARESRLVLDLDDQALALNDWSFGQLCRLARISKDTVNRLQATTAATVLAETLPMSGKPLQVHTRAESIRAVHGAAYTRLYNADLLAVVREFATDFQPPQKGIEGRTGLYCGSRTCSASSSTRPAGPKSTAKRSLRVSSCGTRRSASVRSAHQTFWFQAVCQNHIVWDAVEVVDFSRKHTANVYESLAEIRGIIARLVEKRDERRDGFVRVIEKAMAERLGADAEEATKILHKHGITAKLAKEAVAIAEAKGALTIFSVVDAVTQLASRMRYAGERTETDQKAATLLALVA